MRKLKCCDEDSCSRRSEELIGSKNDAHKCCILANVASSERTLVLDLSTLQIRYRGTDGAASPVVHKTRRDRNTQESSRPLADWSELSACSCSAARVSDSGVGRTKNADTRATRSAGAHADECSSVDVWRPMGSAWTRISATSSRTRSETVSEEDRNASRRACHNVARIGSNHCKQSCKNQ
jgi:hypothetical protein